MKKASLDERSMGSQRRETLDARPANARLKVLHVIGGLGVGGAEALLYRLALRQGNFEHEVICLGGRDWYSARLEQHGVQVHHLGLNSPAVLPTALRRLRSLVRQSHADVVETWMYASNVLAGPIAALSGLPVVWSIHHSTLDTLRLPSRLLVYLGAILARFVPTMIVNCSTRSAAVHAKIGYDAAPGIVIHNGYDPEEFHPDEASREVTRKSLGISNDVFLIGSIGRWHPQKDIPNLLRAVARLREHKIPVHCLLVGNNLDAENVQLGQAIDTAGVRDLVEPLGRRADIVELARALDVHVLASADGEAFPNVVAETMLSGAPNVSTDVGDAALMIGETGWIVSPRDPESLASSIEQAYREWKDSPEPWQQRRRDARQRIVDNFTFEKMASAYEKVWREMAAGSRPVQSA